MATGRARLTLARFNEQKAELPPARGVNRDAELTAPSALAPKLRLDGRAVGSGDWLGVAALRSTIFVRFGELRAADPNPNKKY
jgi:hypothetical protein